MKKLIQCGLLVLVMLAPVSGFSGDFKIATVDLKKAFEGYYKTVQASIANSNNLVDAQKTLNEMKTSREKRFADYQTAQANANDQTLSADERQRYKKSASEIAGDIEIQNQAITNFVFRTETKRRDDMTQHIEDLTKEILSVMQAMAKKQGYTLVLDRTALTMTGNPLVLYTSGENDLTEALIKELNATAPPNLDTGGGGTNLPGTNGSPPK